jgi:hypothetical protein
MPEETGEETYESLGTVPAEAADAPTAADDGSGMNFPVLVLLLVVLAFVTVSNVWLRKRAEKDPESRDGA